jgi:hypothetical protein
LLNFFSFLITCRRSPDICGTLNLSFIHIQFLYKTI